MTTWLYAAWKVEPEPLSVPDTAIVVVDDDWPAAELVPVEVELDFEELHAAATVAATSTGAAKRRIRVIAPGTYGRILSPAQTSDERQVNGT